MQHEVKELLHYLIRGNLFSPWLCLIRKLSDFPTCKQTRIINQPPYLLQLTSSDHSVKQKGYYYCTNIHVCMHTYNVHVHMNILRMWCLARLLPLMIIRLHVCPQDQPRSCMAVLIKDHHEEFRRLFPDSPITPNTYQNGVQKDQYTL